MRGGPFYRSKFIFTFFWNDNASAQRQLTQLSEESYISSDMSFYGRKQRTTYEIKPVFIQSISRANGMAIAN